MCKNLEKQAQPFIMTVNCAWCGNFMHEKRAYKPGLISHGICDPCKKGVMEDFERTNKTMEVINQC